MDASAHRGNLTNTASVTSDHHRSHPANNTDTETTAVITRPTSVAKSDSPDPVIAGNNLTYTLTVTNDGPSDALNVSVTDALPGRHDLRLGHRRRQL